MNKDFLNEADMLLWANMALNDHTKNVIKEYKNIEHLCRMYNAWRRDVLHGDIHTPYAGTYDLACLIVLEQRMVKLKLIAVDKRFVTP